MEKTLHVFDISHNNLGDEEMGMIFQALFNHKYLEKLYASGNRICTKGSSDLCKFLLINDSIKMIDVSRNEINKSTGIHIIKGMMVNMSLENICFENNKNIQFVNDLAEDICDVNITEENLEKKISQKEMIFKEASLFLRCGYGIAYLPKEINWSSFQLSDLILPCVAKGQIEVMEILISEGLDIHSANQDGDTINHLCNIFAQNEIAEWLNSIANINPVGPRICENQKIMLSYVLKESGEFTRHLQAKLEEKGFVVFVAEAELRPGDNWPDEIYQSIKNCIVFIPIITSNYGTTKWTKKEIQLAENENKKVVPIMYDENRREESELSYPENVVRLHLTAQHWINFTGTLRNSAFFEEQFTKLCQVISGTNNNK